MSGQYEIAAPAQDRPAPRPVGQDWWEECDGSFASDMTGLRLVVRRLPDRRQARFLVFARTSAKPDSMIASGTGESVALAMEAAECAALRLSAVNIGQPVRLVLADADEVFLQGNAELLRSRGYHVAVAASAGSALIQLQRTAPPVILLTDIDLGAGMNGLELAAAVHLIWPDTPVLLLTEGIEPDGGRACRDDVLPRPSAPERLLAHVEAMAAQLRH